MSPERGQVVVCIVASGEQEALVRCLASVAEHTPREVAVVVTGGGDGEALPEAIRSRAGFAQGPLEDALAGTAPADVALLSDRTVVAAGWLDGLRDAAASDALVATATALSNHAAFLSVPVRNRPYRQLPQTLTLDEAAARVRERALRARPVIPVAMDHCVLVRRAALDLAGPLDDMQAFSARCVQRGLRHVAADDVLVLHAAAVEAPEDVTPADPALEPLLEEARTDAVGPLGRALTIARQVYTGRRVTIDGRSLGTFVAGTQVLTLELIHALARTDEVRVRVVVPPGPPPESLDDFELVPADAAPEHVGRDDVVHRPFQVERPEDLSSLTTFGERVVLTQLDLIGYRTPGYFPSAEAWDAYRQLTREALAFCDVAVFLSRHAAADARAADLVGEERARVVGTGTDHRVVGAAADPRPPASAPGLADAPFLLCLGTSYRHKNRPFALRLLAALRERHGWEGRLVLAGPEVADGSSAGEEATWRIENPQHAEAVVTLGSVDEHEKAWLYRKAAAVVYPTTYEGFGFVPFEAAQAGTPCLWAAQASLADVLPPDVATLVPWDADASADAALGVLRDEKWASAIVSAVRAAGERLTWDATAAALLEVYDDAVRLPAREAALLARAEMITQSAYWGLRHDIGDTGLALVGPDEPLLPVEAQRTLAGLLSRRATRGPVLRMLLRGGRPTLEE